MTTDRRGHEGTDGMGPDPGDDAALARFLAAGRHLAPLSEALSDAILRDARQVLATRAALDPAPVATPVTDPDTAPVTDTPPSPAPLAPPHGRAGLGWLRRVARALSDALGGGPAVAGLAAAAAAGLMLGLASPALLDPGGFYGSDYTLDDLLPDPDLLLAELATGPATPDLPETPR